MGMHVRHQITEKYYCMYTGIQKICPRVVQLNNSTVVTRKGYCTNVVNDQRSSSTAQYISYTSVASEGARGDNASPISVGVSSIVPRLSQVTKR